MLIDCLVEFQSVTVLQSREKRLRGNCLCKFFCNTHDGYCFSSNLNYVGVIMPSHQVSGENLLVKTAVYK